MYHVNVDIVLKDIFSLFPKKPFQTANTLASEGSLAHLQHIIIISRQVDASGGTSHQESSRMVSGIASA